MVAPDPRPYPGSTASPDDILQLAIEYRKAAKFLRAHGVKGKALSWVPMRLSAIHSTELFLNAYLLAKGVPPEKVRGHFHDLSVRAELAESFGVRFRSGTRDHLRRMTNDREYLISRYGPELAKSFSPINRLMATLDEVAKKCTKEFEKRTEK